MAGSMNKVILVGRLGQDPQMNYTQSGTPVCNFSMATDESYRDQYGNKVEKTEWHKIVCWGKTGELVSEYLNKGSLVLVEGSLQTRKWQDKNGGDRYTTEIKAGNVQFLESKAQSGQGGYVQAPPQQPQPEAGPAFPSTSGKMDGAPF
ncbi:MAG: single-stranded DNA-binding protein [Desulfobacterales bacterium]